jgi:hypothetical protein
MAGAEAKRSADFEAQQLDAVEGLQTQAAQDEANRRNDLESSLETIQVMRAGRGVGLDSPTGQAILSSTTGAPSGHHDVEGEHLRAREQRRTGRKQTRRKGARLAARRRHRLADHHRVGRGQDRDGGPLRRRGRHHGRHRAPDPQERQCADAAGADRFGQHRLDRGGLAEHRGERREASRTKAQLPQQGGARRAGRADRQFRNRLAGEADRGARPFTNDPEGFKNWAQSSTDGAIAEARAGWCRTPSSSCRREFEGAYGSILGEKRAQDRHLDGQAIVARTKMADDDVMSIAATGKLNTTRARPRSRPTRACSAPR